MSAEKERETQVYLAKLSEQAERYEGCVFNFIILSFLLFFFKWVCVFYIDIVQDLFFVLI
jgi:hypothetical protein